MIIFNGLKKNVILVFAMLLLSSCAPVIVTETVKEVISATPFQPVPPMPTFTASPTLTPSPTFTPSPTSSPTNTAVSSETRTITSTSEVISAGPGEVIVPILLYHHISAEIKGSPYSIDPAVFRQQMQWLYDHGYKTITISKLAEIINFGGEIPQRAVVLTFDDGYVDVFKNAYPILQDYGYVATFFIIADTVDKMANLNTRQLKKLIHSGWEIGSHGMKHTNLNNVGVDLEYEIAGSKQSLEEKLGVTINSFAYPYGMANPSVIEFTRNSGYTSAVGLGKNFIHTLKYLYYLSRIEIPNGTTLDGFIARLPWQ